MPEAVTQLPETTSIAYVVVLSPLARTLHKHWFPFAAHAVDRHPYLFAQCSCAAWDEYDQTGKFLIHGFYQKVPLQLASRPAHE